MLWFFSCAMSMDLFWFDLTASSTRISSDWGVWVSLFLSLMFLVVYWIYKEGFRFQALQDPDGRKLRFLSTAVRSWTGIAGLLWQRSKGLTHDTVHHDWPKKTVTPVGHPKFHPICCLEQSAGWISWISEDFDEVVQTQQVGSFNSVRW